MVAALGMFVAILSGGIDLSIGSVMAVSSVFCASLLVMTNNIPVAVLGALVICAVLGTVNGLIVAQNIFHAPRRRRAGKRSGGL